MTILNENLLNALKGAKLKEIKFVASILDRSIKKGISIYEAAKIEKYQPGTKVTFSDKDGITHVAIVEKIMTKRVRLFDKTTKAIVNIYPQQLKTYVPKVYGARGSNIEANAKPINQLDRVKRKYTKKAVTGASVKPINQIDRVKRKYTKKAKAMVDVSALANKYAKPSNAPEITKTKRKYVRNAIWQ